MPRPGRRRIETGRSDSAPPVIVGIDVETANPSGAICEFAAVAIDGRTGDTIFTEASLVDPGDVDWHPATARIHGIRRSQVNGKPRMHDIWHRFLDRLDQAGRARVFAHSASSERNWLSRSLGQPITVPIECTIAMAKRSIALHSYRLSTVCSALGISFMETHRALADATAAAHVARCLISRTHTLAVIKRPEEMREIAGKAPRQQASNQDRGKNPEIIATTQRIGSALLGHRVCITGQFACGWTRKEAKIRIVAHGGTPLDQVSGRCSLLVIAGETTRLKPATLTSDKARRALAFGVQVVNETQFRRLVNE